MKRIIVSQKIHVKFARTQQLTRFYIKLISKSTSRLESLHVIFLFNCRDFQSHQQRRSNSTHCNWMLLDIRLVVLSQSSCCNFANEILIISHYILLHHLLKVDLSMSFTCDFIYYWSMKIRECINFETKLLRKRSKSRYSNSTWSVTRSVTRFATWFVTSSILSSATSWKMTSIATSTSSTYVLDYFTANFHMKRIIMSQKIHVKRISSQQVTHIIVCWSMKELKNQRYHTIK